MDFPSSSLRPREAYELLTSLIVPRPIAWVTTMNAAGETNLAPFSYFQGLASDPPLVTIAISDRKGGTPKDTLRLARESGGLCIHLVEEPDLARMNATSADYPPGTSEIDALHIETVPCTAIPGRRVTSARAALECRLVDVHRYGQGTQVNLVVAQVVHFHVHDSLLDGTEKRASPHAIQPVSRLGGAFYAQLGERIALERPKL